MWGEKPHLSEYVINGSCDCRGGRISYADPFGGDLKEKA